MRISIIANQQNKTQQTVKKLQELLNQSQFTFDEKNPEIVLSVGGDGTLLSAFHRYNHLLDQIRFVGIHTGHLGFYTDWRDYELEELVESLIQDQGASIDYPLLDVKVRTFAGQESHYLALNESTIKSVNKTMLADIYIKNERFESFRGDGLSIATPTGSTGYNKSVGGAVLHPRINALQMTEIASLNNRVYRTLGSPLIIASDEWIKIELEEKGEYILSIDQLNIPTENIAELYYRIADERIHFASYRHMHFWNRVKDAFIKEEKGTDEKNGVHLGISSD